MNHSVCCMFGWTLNLIPDFREGGGDKYIIVSPLLKKLYRHPSFLPPDQKKSIKKNRLRKLGQNKWNNSARERGQKMNNGSLNCDSNQLNLDTYVKKNVFMYF